MYLSTNCVTYSLKNHASKTDSAHFKGTISDTVQLSENGIVGVKTGMYFIHSVKVGGALSMQAYLPILVKCFTKYRLPISHFWNNNNGPLTAVLSVSMTAIPNCPCFYRWVLRVWCHLWPHQGGSTCAKLPGFWLVSLYLPCGHMITVCFGWLWSILVIWPKQSAMAVFN